MVPACFYILFISTQHIGLANSHQVTVFLESKALIFIMSLERGKSLHLGQVKVDGDEEIGITPFYLYPLFLTLLPK
jgi:hypothetical protein